jgi:acyl-CoA thioesterase-1
MIRHLTLILLLCMAGNGSAATPTIVVLGDSLSAGYGLRAGEGWVDLLQQKLQRQDYKYQVVNASISGDTTRSALSRLAAATQSRPAILIVELGGNDGLRGLSLSDMKKNLRRIIDHGQQQGAKVLLLGMQIPPNYGPLFTQRFAQTYAQLAHDTSSSLVPFFLAGLQDSPRHYQRDQIHPNASAQPLLLKNVWPQLQPLL